MEQLAGWRPLYALDIPGYGGSFDPQGEPAAATFGEWILEALSGLGISRFHVCGQHTGSHLAIELAATRPDLVLSILMDGVVYADAAERAKHKAQAGLTLPIEPDGGYLMTSWNFLKAYFPGFHPQLQHIEIMGALRCLTSRQKAMGAIFDQDVPALLARVLCPMLITVPEDDGLAAYLDRIRREQPHIPTLVTPPAGIASPELHSAGFAGRIRNLVDSVEHKKAARV